MKDNYTIKAEVIKDVGEPFQIGQIVYVRRTDMEPYPFETNEYYFPKDSLKILTDERLIS